MTLCIAALCFGDKSMCILSADAKVESNIAGNDYAMDKMRQISENWYGLMAGPVGECCELFDLYKEHVFWTEINRGHALDHLRVPLAELRKRMANRVTQQMAALSYKEFLRFGKQRLSEELYRQIEYAISNQHIQAQMILVGLVHGRELRMFLCSDGDICEYPNFCAIGSGAVVAEAILSQREHSYLADPEEALYAVYEAARIGRIAPGVGEHLSMTLLRPVLVAPGEFKLALAAISLKGESILGKAFEEYGPKPLPSSMSFRYVEMVETHDPYFVAEVFHHEEADDSGTAASGREQETKE